MRIVVTTLLVLVGCVAFVIAALVLTAIRILTRGQRPPIMLLLALLLASCASPTQPTRPVALALAGQSNAALLKPFLAEHVVAFSGEVTTIAPCWSAEGACWSRLSLPSTLDAFVWSQGESDVLTAETPLDVYAARWADLVRRVRAGRPGLLVVVLQMGPMFDGPRSGALGPVYQAWRRDWAARDGHAVFIETADLEWRSDEVHMTDAGYTALAARIVAAVEARR